MNAENQLENIKVTDKKVKSLIHTYYDYHEEKHYVFEKTIMSVHIDIDKKVITLWAYRPGLVIGVGGKLIDDLNLFINKQTGIDFKIDIKEFDPLA